MPYDPFKQRRGLDGLLHGTTTKRVGPGLYGEPRQVLHCPLLAAPGILPFCLDFRFIETCWTRVLLWFLLYGSCCTGDTNNLQCNVAWTQRGIEALPHSETSQAPKCQGNRENGSADRPLYTPPNGAEGIQRIGSSLEVQQVLRVLPRGPAPVSHSGSLSVCVPVCLEVVSIRRST